MCVPGEVRKILCIFICRNIVIHVHVFVCYVLCAVCFHCSVYSYLFIYLFCERHVDWRTLDKRAYASVCVCLCVYGVWARVFARIWTACFSRIKFTTLNILLSAFIGSHSIRFCGYKSVKCSMFCANCELWVCMRCECIARHRVITLKKTPMRDACTRCCTAAAIHTVVATNPTNYLS